MSNISRRDILKGSTAALVGISAMSPWDALAAPVAPVEPAKAPNGRLRIGIIGCGGKGRSGMELAAEHGDIVALVDVDLKNRYSAMVDHPKAAAFDDYREMYKAMKGKVDAVVISIPDHHHAVASALAMRMGIHCYCEKPLTRTIWEARQIARIARETKVATQMGNQSTASSQLRKVAALVQAGHFGHVKEVHLWTNRAKGWWPQGVERPEAQPIPKELDFEMWLGPRPARPYNKVYHPFSWRGWWDFGTGSLGDMGCHIFNTPFMSLDLRDPLSVQAETSGHNRDSFPEWAKVHYVFGPRGNRPGLDLHWYDGGQQPDPSLVPGLEIGGNGAILVCEKDTIFALDESNTQYKLVSGKEIPDIAIDESPGHMAEFARAALGGKPARSNFPDYAGPLAETVLLGNLAIWANGPKVEWDAKNLKVKGTNEFDALIKPSFREGFGV